MIKSFMLAAVSVAVAVAVAPMVAAQWPDFPTPGVPLLPNGQPNLEGPAPRAADGKPDLSGLWAFRQVPGARGQGGQVGGGPDIPTVAQAEPVPPPAPGTVPLATFFDIGGGTRGGITPPYTPWAAEVRRLRMADNQKDNPDAHCLPLGLTQLHMHPQPRKIIQLPKLILILYEAQGGVRQIFMDGRRLPDNDPQPWWYGYSVGRWEGDELVVETTGFRDDVWLDVHGSPLTTTGKMTERIKRLNYGTLQTDVTIEDPKSYTKPFTVRINHRVMVNTDLIEFVCNENEKSTRYFDK
jgi:hypothetical protein